MRFILQKFLLLQQVRKIYTPLQQLWGLYHPVCILILWFHILYSGLHWAYWAIIMAPKEPKTS